MTVLNLVSRSPQVAIDDKFLAELTRTLAEDAAEYDRDGAFPHANLKLLQQHGLLGLACDKRSGGGGADLPLLRKVIAAVAKGEPSTALVLCMQYLYHRRLADNPNWPAELKRRVIREALEEGALINSLRVEPELGSPARGGLPQTVAKRQADGWILDGHKLYTTGIPGLTWLAVWARSDDPVPLVGTWLVHRDTPGIRVVESWSHLGMRATGSHEVIFENVHLPLEHAVDVFPADAPPPINAPAQADFNRGMSTLLGAIYDGAAQAARDWLIEWLGQRAPASLGAPLSTVPRVQETVGDIERLLLSNRLQLDALSTHPLSSQEAGLIKVSVTENAVAVVEKALELTGNHGLSLHHPLQRHYRNVLCGRVHTPQRDSALILAGKTALNLL
ncbi:acyl-CoA dehydrogenase family protein [Pseudomonas sp. TTU2014-080ASC]|uniref:acyl-CoA dehydrogenase family protein n=1 Tax=Pseudomonas sp. TTU2014-080ASC TaxID=1729724 RepID=UPI0007188EFD|nr:acyl-CoA dehydrogenase family protein [Pseudomonas sp. TTU2014-080ASC]KRW62092.1 acyl-CoA dehydrogenase [Pseudomonas sp. TTU2014-080ASC]